MQWVGLLALAAAVASALKLQFASALCIPFHCRLALVLLARSTAVASLQCPLVILPLTELWSGVCSSVSLASCSFTRQRSRRAPSHVSAGPLERRSPVLAPWLPALQSAGSGCCTCLAMAVSVLRSALPHLKPVLLLGAYARFLKHRHNRDSKCT